MEALRKINRTLLEMHTGILFCGGVCQAVGLFVAKDRWGYAKSLWFGIAFAMVSALHIYRSTDRALDFDEKTATKLIFRAYLTRYICVAVILVIIMLTGVMNPLIVFMAYMSLKVTVFLQPFTHKLYNKLFREEDPVPQALPAEEGEREFREQESRE